MWGTLAFNPWLGYNIVCDQFRKPRIKRGLYAKRVGISLVRSPISAKHLLMPHTPSITHYIDEVTDCWYKAGVFLIGCVSSSKENFLCWVKIRT